MARFLGLPIELRVLIIKYLILAARQPTYDSTIVATYEAAQAFGPEYCSRKNVKEIIYEENDEKNCPNVLNLLLTSRQIHNETIDCLAQMACICKVDVAIMYGRNIWPTFTSIPLKSRKIDIVEATIHGAGDGPPCMKPWTAEYGGLAPMAFRFWRLLKNFLNEGPCLPSWTANSSISVIPGSRITSPTIGLLDLNVIDPDPHFDDASTTLQLATSIQSDHSVCAHCHTRCNVGRAESGFINLEAESTFEFLRDGLQKLLIYLTEFYGSSLYTRVGSIRMHVRGVKTGEIDLGTTLNILPLKGNGGKTMTWIKWAKKARKQDGLSCPEEEEEVKRLSVEEWHVFLREWCENAISINSDRP